VVSAFGPGPAGPDLGILAAVLSAVAYNAGLTIEKRALERLPGIDARRPIALLRTVFAAPAWLSGFALMLVGLALQVAALTLAPISVVQPVLASGIIILLVFTRIMLHERLSRTELGCVLLIAAAIAGIALSQSGTADRVGYHVSGALLAEVAGPACAVGLLLGWLSLRPAPGRHRMPVFGIGYGLAAGLLYGVAGLAIKALAATVIVRHAGIGLIAALITAPYPYLAFACSAAGMLIFQTALQRCRASIVAPVSSITGSVFFMVTGTWLFGERLPTDPVRLGLRLAGAVAAGVVIVVLSRRPAGRAGAGAPRRDVDVDVEVAAAPAAGGALGANESRRDRDDVSGNAAA
jgi:drug/metabolite transporter (DMT)-like permease